MKGRCSLGEGEPFQSSLPLAIYSLSTAGPGHPERKLGNPTEVSISYCVVKKGGREEGSEMESASGGITFYLFVLRPETKTVPFLFIAKTASYLSGIFTNPPIYGERKSIQICLNDKGIGNSVNSHLFARII